MKVTIGSCWQCSCGHEMLFLDQPEANRPRRMMCVNQACAEYQRNYIEPTFEAKPYMVLNA